MSSIEYYRFEGITYLLLTFGLLKEEKYFNITHYFIVKLRLIFLDFLKPGVAHCTLSPISLSINQLKIENLVLCVGLDCSVSRVSAVILQP